MLLMTCEMQVAQVPSMLRLAGSHFTAAIQTVSYFSRLCHNQPGLKKICYQHHQIKLSYIMPLPFPSVGTI